MLFHRHAVPQPVKLAERVSRIVAAGVGASLGSAVHRGRRPTPAGGSRPGHLPCGPGSVLSSTARALRVCGGGGSPESVLTRNTCVCRKVHVQLKPPRSPRMMTDGIHPKNLESGRQAGLLPGQIRYRHVPFCSGRDSLTRKVSGSRRPCC